MNLKLGQIFGTAPTHVAVDNFAARLHTVTSRITDKYNEGKAIDDPSRLQRRLVVRTYSMEEEVSAFWKLLEAEVTSKEFTPVASKRSKHHIHLSCAEWLMKALGGSPETQLHPDDSWKLHQICSDDDEDATQESSKLLAVVRKQTTWAIFVEEGKVSTAFIVDMMNQIRLQADILCSTPARCCKDTTLRDWRNENVKGIAVDEAANMTRPDLYSVWGNTLLPCALAGDDKQLPPTIMTGNERWEYAEDGKTALSHRNRFTPDGKISPLEFLRGAGFPVYRMRTQLRMARDLFFLCHKNIYHDIEHISYGPNSEISGSVHDIGRALEAYTVGKYGNGGGFTAAPAGTFAPIFIQCKNAPTFMNATGSKYNRGQSTAALDFIKDFVETQGVDASRIVIITPYKANVDVISRLRRSSYPTLEAIPPCATIDSFQGQEGDICVVVLGTTKASGPGFTTDDGRLNVALSRQRSGLVIVGDLNTTQAVDRAKMAAKNKGCCKVGKRFRVVSTAGEVHWVKATILDNIYTWFMGSGRVVEWVGVNKEVSKKRKVEELEAEE